jgi:hypothetical protein
VSVCSIASNLLDTILKEKSHKVLKTKFYTYVSVVLLEISGPLFYRKFSQNAQNKIL